MAQKTKEIITTVIAVVMTIVPSLRRT